MYSQLLIFVSSSLLLFTLSRLLLASWQHTRLQHTQDWQKILIGGLRIDLHLIAAASAISWLLAPWLDANPWAQTINAVYLTLIWCAFFLLEVSTPQFIIEYDSRPNRLYIDYLTHPREVMGMLWKGYKALIISAVLSVVLATSIMFYVLLHSTTVYVPISIWLAAPISLGSAAILFLLIRGTLTHRPINPSTVAFCGDAMVNTLPLNSLYNVLYAVYCIKNERSATQAYGSLPTEQMLDTISRCAGFELNDDQPNLPTLHAFKASNPSIPPKNIVIIIEESLGAQFVGHLGGAELTPYLDDLAKHAWYFENAYATGTRSVRGLEAVTAGFPPTISDAAVRLSGAQSGFFTLAQLVNQQGYTSRFIYGGEAHFDNMKGFFLGNGFKELHDQPTFKNPEFVGTWGASDEDMFNKLHDLLSTAKPDNAPTLNVAFSVSNHSPWEYPTGRITPEGEPASVENTIRYADWALGQFFAKARESDYWQNTVFLVVADHDARVGGKSLVPVRHFHIPALFLGGSIPPRSDARLVSQIDLPVTLLSLAGINGEHPMIGHDLTLAHTGGRAMMQYGDNYGYLKNNILTVLEPLREATQWTYRAPEQYHAIDSPNQELCHEALAHVLWPSWAYKNKAHSLPQFITATRSQVQVDLSDSPVHARSQ